MEHGWSEEQERSFAAAAAFAREAINPTLEARQQTGALSRDLWRRCASFGLLGLLIPAEYGGLGGSALGAVRAMQGLGFGCLDHGWLMALNAHIWCVAQPLFLFGNDQQRARYLPPLVRGDWIGAIAVTETEHGSDTRRFQTVARPAANGFILQGAKTFITNAPCADLFLVFASTQPDADYFGASLFLVERQAPGVRVGPSMEKMGLKTSPMSEVFFEDVPLGPEQLLGEAGAGQALLHAAMEWERGGMLAPAVGVMERLLATTAAYCRERKQFGRPIGDFEAVAHQLAEMKLRLETSRLLLEHFAQRKDAGLPAFTEAVMTKLQISESWVHCAATALRLHGAYGYCTGLECERTWRDAIASTLYSGTSEIQRNLIAESLLTRSHEHPRQRATRQGGPA